MEINSRELEVYSSRTLSRVENFSTASSSKHTAYEPNRYFGKKLLKDSEASGSQNMVVNCSRSKVCSHSRKGKEILQAHIAVEELNDRLKILEQENEVMKQAFIETIEERKKLVNEIYEDFRKLRRCCRLGNQVTGLKFWYESFSINPTNEAVMGSGLSQVLSEASNPCIVTRDHRANLDFSSWFS